VHKIHITEMKNPLKIITGKSEEEVPLGRWSHILEDNIEMDFRIIGSEDLNWSMFAQDMAK
jgi:hypothetical protein